MRFTRILRKSLMPNLVRQIEFGGPITIASYMQRKVVSYVHIKTMSDPGIYRTKPIGQEKFGSLGPDHGIWWSVDPWSDP